MKINLKKIILYLFSFYLLYLPDFTYLIGVNGFVILSIFITLFLLKYLLTKNKKYFSLYKKKSIFLFIVFTVISSLYYMIRTSIAGVSIYDINNLRIIQNIIPIFYLIGCITIYFELDNLNYSKQQKYKFIINVATIQGIIALAMLLIPSLKNIAINIFYQSSEFNKYIFQSRLYGICNGDYTYSLQIVHSILALFCLVYMYYYKDKKSLISLIIILMVTFLNGRFGLIIFSVGFIVFILYILLKSMNPTKVVNIIFISTVIFATGYYIVLNYIPNVYKLVEHAILDISSFLSTGDSSTEMYDLVSSFRIPHGLYLIVGMGYRVFGGAGKMFNYNEKSADIGFVNDLYMGGLIYSFLLYAGYIYMLRKIISFSKKFSFERIMCNILLVSIILANIKGEVFRSQMIITLLLILLVFMLFEGEKNYGKK